MKSLLLRMFLPLFFVAHSSTLNALVFCNFDPTYNTSPTDEVSTPWSFQGNWGTCAGTVIAPHYFITASHVGGAVGDLFHLDGLSYTTIDSFDDPETDLRILKVRESFPAYPLLYERKDELAKPVLMFGRGPARGDPIVTTNIVAIQNRHKGTTRLHALYSMHGWKWSAYDGTMRWGKNQVTKVLTFSASKPALGEMLVMSFRGEGADEACASGGDSGAGLFIEDEGVWKLAGVNYAVSGPYRITVDGAPFYGAVTNECGLYRGLSSTTPVGTSGVTVPTTYSFATRISSRMAWIETIIKGNN